MNNLRICPLKPIGLLNIFSMYYRASDISRYATTIQEVSNPRIKNGHPTQKPVDLMKYFIETYTLPNDTILGNCMGSGTTGIASTITNRSFIGIELNDEYYTTAIQRIEKGIE